MRATPTFDNTAAFANSHYVLSNFNEKSKATSGLPFFGDVKALFRYLKDGPTTAHLLVVLFALGYFIFPFDAVPDLIPFVGYTDDAAVIAAAVATIGSTLNKYRR